MSAPLLETKLFLPQPRRGLVARPRLRERLDRGLGSKLMLVSAPAGFGKTTLLVDWATAVSTRTETSATWLSLDAGDNEPSTFWSYLIAAVRAAVPGVGSSALDLLQGPQPPPIEAVLTTLLNDLGAASTDVVLVLDDFHSIGSLEVQTGIEFLLEHLPPRLHLVIATRADPALPLARLRAGGELVEVRAGDLRFTHDEAAAYLNDAMGLSLTQDDVGALEGRTEGWIAALQLAALSMAGRDDAASFIAGFAGDDRYVVDYLVEEVLQRQPENVHAFLMQTSVLDRMTGALCDAVTGQDGGRAMLESLERDNLFVVALDDRREWYRYHHLFADLLRARLLDEHAEEVGPLHRRASQWFEQHGDRPEAIRHAMAGGDFPAAAGLLELALPALQRDRREAMIRSWLEQLPDDVLRQRPILCNGLAGAMLSTGTFEGVEPLLDAAEQEGSAADTLAMDQESLARLPAEVAIHRAGLALTRGDVAGTVQHAKRALELARDQDHLVRGAALALTGLAAWTSGDLEVAHSSYTACLVEFERIDHVSDFLGCSLALADMQLAQGRLGTATNTYEAALRLAREHGKESLRGTADMHVGLAALQRERGDVAAARETLLRGRALGEHAGLPQHHYRWRVELAQISEAEGDVDAAFALLDEAVPLYDGDFSPNFRPVPALRARLWIRHGRLAEARAWAEQASLSTTDELSYLHEYEHVTLARVLVAEGSDLAGAIDLLGRLGQAAEEGRRPGSLIDIRITEALAHQAREDTDSALASLEAALALAEPEGYVRTFVDEGAPMTALLRLVAKSAGTSSYLQRLQDAYGGAPAIAPTAPGLVDQLSARELDVLRLLASDLTGPEIARHLVVSLNTVRTHTKNVYMKLGVNTRMAAVRRARELELI